MKKTIFLICFVLLSVPPAHAANPGKKLLRGITNIVTAPLEIPKQTRAYWIKGAEKTPHIIAWLFCGAVWGTVEMVKRTGSGVWDVVSFPVEKPVEYKPLMLPEYVFQEWPKNPVSGR